MIKQMKQLITSLFILLIASASAQESITPVDIHGALQVEGAKIVGTKHGNPTQLRGMSMLWSQWGEGSKYYNANVIKTLVDDWKVNVVRAAMGVSTSVQGYITYPGREKAKITTVVDAAIENGIYVIIDWHSHDAHNEEAEAKAFFAEMAQLYGEYPNVIYEVFNEPTQATWAGDIKPYCEAVIDTIRAHDPDNLIICGTRNWSQEVEEAADNPINDVNVAYTLHYYAATHTDNLRAKAQAAIDKNLPLFVTEFGTTEASGNGRIDFTETDKWWDFLDANDISWCNWSISDKDESASAITPSTPINGKWTSNNYTISGAFVRNELRNKYELPIYQNDLSIKIDTSFGVLRADTSYHFNISLYNKDTLIHDSLVSYMIEAANGGIVSDSGIFIPNGESGTFKLFVTAQYDTLITTKSIDFIVSDVKPGELTNESDKTYLALTLADNYYLSTGLLYPNKSTTIPNEGDIVKIGSNDYVWSVVNEPSGIFSQADSKVKSFLAVYVINPITRTAKINRGDDIGFGRFYVNGVLTGYGTFELPKGENIFFIEYDGDADSSAFEFTILTPDDEPMPFITYSLSSEGFFDCANTWYGEAYISEDCGCIGGTTGKNHCPGPFNGVAATIPGRIESEEYDYGIEGETFYDTDANNNGSSSMRAPDGVDISSDANGASIGWIARGEWLKYSVEVTKTGKYVVDFRVASGQTTGAIMLRLDDEDIFENNISVPNTDPNGTNGWGTWKTITSDTISIESGLYILEFYAANQYFNIDYIDFKLVVEEVGFEDDLLSNTELFPNPFSNTINLATTRNTSFKIYNTLGALVSEGSCNGQCEIGSDLNKGFYLLELIQDEKTAIQRIIKE